MECTVNYTDGRGSVNYDSINDAVTALLGEYPDGVAMVWECEEDSLDDDGADAVASIEVVAHA